MKAAQRPAAHKAFLAWNIRVSCQYSFPGEPPGVRDALARQACQLESWREYN